MGSFFIDPAGVNNEQLAFLTAVYGVVLYQASNLVSSGSELLLLIHEVAGIVGSIILPILGAVPDGMMVLFSGLGPDAQEEVSVGVGALAGSTAMLLTIPWFIAVAYGRVPMGPDGKKPQYGKAADGGGKGKGGGGIQFQDSIKSTSKIMFATTFLYLIIQIPASLSEMKGASTPVQSSTENMWALVALVMSLAAFVYYLYMCYKDATQDKQLPNPAEDKQVHLMVDNMMKKNIALYVALDFGKKSTTGATPLTGTDERVLKKILRRFFDRYDNNQSRTLEFKEFMFLLQDLGVKVANYDDEFKTALDGKPTDEIDFDHFVKWLPNFLATHQHQPKPKPEKDEEEEEIPEDLQDLTPDEQRKRILLRSFGMMGAGLALVLIFTDPTVDVLSEWGNRLGVPPFYISFILAPFASNASELLSAYTYASKKSSSSITTSLSTLVGAACMNNTFCFAIFMALVWVKGLAWQFTAETIAIITSQWLITLIVFKSNVQTIKTGFLILSVYPLSLFLVWFLENKVGWD